LITKYLFTRKFLLDLEGKRKNQHQLLHCRLAWARMNVLYTFKWHLFDILASMKLLQNI